MCNAKKYRFRSRLAGSNLHQMGIRKGFCLNAYTHEANIKIAGNRTGCSYTQSDNAFCLTHKGSCLFYFFKIKQIQCPLQGVYISSENIFCNRSNGVCFR